MQASRRLISLYTLAAVLTTGPLLRAQTFTTLHSFTNGFDGAYPVAGLLISGNVLYGTTTYGGATSNGMVFRINTDGTGFQPVYEFSPLTRGFSGSNYDGSEPSSGLILAGGRLYGTANEGGTPGWGTVFSVDTNGQDFTNIHSFTYADGSRPYCTLVMSSNTLYGTASSGGSGGYGTVFQVNSDGTSFATLYDFEKPGTFTDTNFGGASPYAGFVLSGGTLYGTAGGGGFYGHGTVYALTPGTNFAVLHDFAEGLDGANPGAALVLVGGALYGTTLLSNTIFRINVDGSNFTNLFNFPQSAQGGIGGAPLIASGNMLYGTTAFGGQYGYGAVFQVNIDGSAFTNLHSFTPATTTNSDGVHPTGALLLSGNTLYGTTSQGGPGRYGTVYSLTLGAASPPPTPLNIALSQSDIILTWPTNATASKLQSTTSLSASTVWSTNLPAPVVVNGQNTVTISPSGSQEFYRLGQ